MDSYVYVPILLHVTMHILIHLTQKAWEFAEVMHDAFLLYFLLILQSKVLTSITSSKSKNELGKVEEMKYAHFFS